MDTEDVMYVHTMEYYSAVKKEWNNITCNNMDEPGDYNTKWSKPDKDKYHIILLICRILKRIQRNLFAKYKLTHRYRTQTYGD